MKTDGLGIHGWEGSPRNSSRSSRTPTFLCVGLNKECVSIFVKQRLHCMDGKAGTLKPRPLGEVEHGTKVDKVMQFDFFHTWVGWALGDNGIGYKASKYFLVLVEDVSGPTLLEPMAACTPAVTAETFLRWCHKNAQSLGKRTDTARYS